MVIANSSQIARFTNEGTYGVAAKVNAAAVAVSGGKLPCYAIPGKRAAFKWVSIGSKCVIGCGEATKWLARFGVDIASVEAAA